MIFDHGAHTQARGLRSLLAPPSTEAHAVTFGGASQKNVIVRFVLVKLF